MATAGPVATPVVDNGKGLTKAERAALENCERDIERGLKGVLDLGRALETIRKSKLYREVYPSFEAYCNGRWGFSGGTAQRMIGLSKVAAYLSVASKVEPQNLSQMEPLISIKSRVLRKAVWDQAVADAGGQPTRQGVARAAVEVAGHTRSWPGRNVTFVQDLEEMAKRLVGHYTEYEIHELMSLVMSLLAKRRAA